MVRPSWRGRSRPKGGHPSGLRQSHRSDPGPRSGRQEAQSGRIGDSSLPGHDLRHLANGACEKCGLDSGDRSGCAGGGRPRETTLVRSVDVALSGLRTGSRGSRHWNSTSTRRESHPAGPALTFTIGAQPPGKPKFEARNPKQIQSTKPEIRNTEYEIRRDAWLPFRGVWNIRISDFEFRVSPEGLLDFLRLRQPLLDVAPDLGIRLRALDFL